MSEITTEEIIRALRCISSVPDEWNGCDGCPYYQVENYSGELVTGCDCDKIDRDAADRLEKLENEKRRDA